MISSKLREVTGSWFLLTPSEVLVLSFLPSYILSLLILRVRKRWMYNGGTCNVHVTRCHFVFQTCGKTLSACKIYVGVQETEAMIWARKMSCKGFEKRTGWGGTKSMDKRGKDMSVKSTSKNLKSRSRKRHERIASKLEENKNKKVLKKEVFLLCWRFH